jgi:DNA-directed RNA polymerase specialized sigma24 family protein
MTSPEPSRHQQGKLHQRILQDDPTAFSELCELALPHLASFLRLRFPQHESHLCETVVIDLLLDYQARPEQYDPCKLSLFAYLRMAARRDMLNAIDKQSRHEKHLTGIEKLAVELETWGRNLFQRQFDPGEWLQQYTDASFEEILTDLQADLDAADEQILLLMLDGVRDSNRYAEVMGISHLEISAQRRAVKRAKDRITQKLRRLGDRIGRS